MSKGLTAEAGRHLAKGPGKGAPAPEVAKDPGISIRHVRRLRAGLRKTGTMRAQAGRLRARITGARIRPTAGARQGRAAGAARAAGGLGGNHDIGYAAAYRVLRKSGAAEAPAAKPGRRRRVRHGRAYPSAMRHADRHAMRDPRFSGMDPIACLDDAPGCVTGAALLGHAASGNAAMLPGPAVGRFGAPASMPSGNGSCLAGRNGRRKGTGARRPAVLGEGLPEGDIAPTGARPCRPQASGRPERFHRSPEGETRRHGGLGEYVDHCNGSGPHFSLDIGNYGTPRMAFRSKRATVAIRKNDPKWMERTPVTGRHTFHTIQHRQAPAATARAFLEGVRFWHQIRSRRVRLTAHMSGWCPTNGQGHVSPRRSFFAFIQAQPARPPAAA